MPYDYDKKQNKEGAKSAAARPSNITTFSLDHAMVHLIQALITKTGEKPSTVNRLVKQRLYRPLKAFAAKNPTQLRALAQRVDFLKLPAELSRHPRVTWYFTQAALAIQDFGDELLKADLTVAYPRASVQMVQDPTSIRQHVFDFIKTRQPVEAGP